MEDLLPDGNFLTEIILEGGTGRTTIQSPANVHIENGVITAEIVWSSPNYDLMIVDGKEYTPISNENGQSVFMVEIPSLDTPLEIKAETVAMSTPHLIDYTITVSGKEILNSEAENTSSEIQSLTSEEISSMLESIMSRGPISGGETHVIYSATVAGDNDGGGIPPLAVVGISVALGAAVAYVAMTLGKNKKK